MQLADIQALIDRVAVSAQSASEATRFYASLTEELGQSLGCSQVVVWQSTSANECLPFARHPVDVVVEGDASQAIKQAFSTAASSVESVSGGIHAVVPVAIEGRVVTVIEAKRSETSHPNLDADRFAQFLEVLAELATAFHRRADLATAREELEWRSELDRFVLLIHRSLDPLGTAHSIVNEGRQLVGCDRLSLVARRTGSFRVEAVSGLSEVNRRSNVVRALEKLATVAMRYEPRLSHPCGKADHPPQLEQAIDSYCDQSGAVRIEIVALDSDSEQAALVAETFAADTVAEEMTFRLEAIAAHAATAWGRAREHRSVFLLPLWAAIGKAWPRSASGWGSWMAVATTLSVIAIALVVIPADFQITAEGTLQPANQRHMFAGTDGVITELSVEEGSRVEQSSFLLMIENPDLALKLEEVSGELQTTEKKLASLRIARLAEENSTRADPVRLNQLAAEEAELNVWRDSLQRQLELLHDEQQRQTHASPIAGTVITWNVTEELETRPVSQGQRLMTVADLDGSWLLELDLPAHRAGHVARAVATVEEPLAVEFVLATQPEKTYQGTLQQMAEMAYRDDSGQAFIRTTVAVDSDSLAERKPGAVASAKIDCGRRSLGYVLFGDLIEFVQRKVMFRLG